MTAVDPSTVAATLSGPMRRALARAQEDLFADRAVVVGHGMTIKALRTRRIVTRERPALLTAFGRAVIAVGQKQSPPMRGRSSRADRGAGGPWSIPANAGEPPADMGAGPHHSPPPPDHP